MIGMAAVGGVLPKSLAHEPAVHPRQHQIQHDEIGRRCPRPGQHVAAGREVVDRMARPLEIMPDEIRDILTVFDDEHARHGADLMHHDFDPLSFDAARDARMPPPRKNRNAAATTASSAPLTAMTLGAENMSASAPATRPPIGPPPRSATM